MKLRKHAGENQSQEQFPKGKTFSRSYDCFLAGKETALPPDGYLPPVLSNEKNAPFTSPSSAGLESVPPQEEYFGSEKSDEPDEVFNPGSFFIPDQDEEETNQETGYAAEEDPSAETEYEAEPFFKQTDGQEQDLTVAGPFSWFDQDTDNLPESVGNDAHIRFKKKKYSIRVGKKTDLKNKLEFRPSGSLKWKSSDKKIAKVSNKGILKPKKKGKITVMVKSKDGERAKVKIRIRSAKKKTKALPWESLISGKKITEEKKWFYFA